MTKFFALFQWLLRALGMGWRWLFCSLSNLRRWLLRGRLPDYVVIVLDQELRERTPNFPWWYEYIPGFRQPMSLEWLSDALQRIAGDPKVKGALFLVKGADLSLAQAQSLTALFGRFRQWSQQHQNNKGGQPKQIIFHLEQVTTPAYIAACAADQVLLTPLTTWEVLGLRSAPTFFKNTLAHLGIEVDVVRVAPWKTAADMYSQAAMTSEFAEQVNWLLESWYGDIVTAISQGRKLTTDQVQGLIDGAPWNAQAATEKGLVDAVVYEDELPTRLGSADTPAKLRPYHKIRPLLWRRPLRRHAHAIGVLSLTGAIVPGESRSQPVPLPIVGRELMGSSTVQQLVRAARQDESLAAVVLHVDSPGGSALASDIIWRELTLLNQEKPVIVYMGDTAASGGYYISCLGRKIVAQRATLTGSIGVIMAKPNLKDAYTKIDATRATIQRGKHADLYDDVTGWCGERRETVEASVQHIYSEFKQRVATGRDLPYDGLDAIANGRVWTGAQALTHGLVDALGDFQQAVDLACAAAELPTDGTVPLVNIEPSQERLLAEPLQAIEAALGLDLLRQARQVAGAALQGNLAALFAHERYWLIVEGLPKIQ